MASALRRDVVQAAAVLDSRGLLAAVLARLGASLEHIEITGVVDGVVTATVAIGDAAGTVVLPARASDALALALRMDAPILVADDVLSLVAARVAEAETRTGSRPPMAAEPASMSQAERWNQLLAHLSTSRSPKRYEG